MRPQLTGLWRHQDFLKLWGAQTTSIFGTQLASLAYSLTAVLTLQATPVQIGMLNAVASASAALVGLFAGVVVDRTRRRPLLIGTDLGRGLLAATIPLAAVLGALHIWQLYIVRFLFGALSILSEIAHMAFLPSIVEREQLLEGNSKLSATESVASIAGSSLSGVLVQLLTAPMAILVDVISFIFSAFFIWLIRTPEPDLKLSVERRSVRSEIREGLQVVFGNPVLRPLSQAIALHFLFVLVISTILILYAVRELHIEPVLLGVILAAFGPGFLLGALVAGRVARRYGIGRAMVGATLLNAFAVTLIPLAGGSRLLTVSMLIAAHFLLALGIQVHGINLMSLRQAITPHRLQGRMNASFRVINVCAMMIGALLAGLLGEAIGLRITLVVGACGMFLPFVRLLLSPVRNLNEQPS
ncbi:MAG TPA: MFS transporter [Pyrinomonadaceae bacterium]|jgi:predicted MFS family arabinose efflux permease